MPVRAEGVQKKVLVVDDLPEIGDIVRATLHRVRLAKVHVTIEINSRRALDLVERESYDLVISDFRMREVNGLQVLAAARRHHPEGIRVLMTGYHDIPATARDIEEASVDAYVQKPLQTQEFLLMALELLQQNEDALREHRAAARHLERTAADDAGVAT